MSTKTDMLKSSKSTVSELVRNYEVGIISAFWNQVACSDGFQA